MKSKFQNIAFGLLISGVIVVFTLTPGCSKPKEPDRRTPPNVQTTAKPTNSSVVAHLPTNAVTTTHAASQAPVQKALAVPNKALNQYSASAEPPRKPAEQPQEEANVNAFFIDRMETGKNLLGGRCAPYWRPPSKIMMSKGIEYGRKNSGLRLTYKQVNVGGAYGQGGWCGYYTLLVRDDRYFDASAYTFLTFWVRGENGGERFQVGVADKQLGMIEDNVKSKPIEEYLPAKKVTTEWQKAVIPLNDMFVDYNLVHSISINFEASLFDADENNGTVYIDDLAFEKNSPPDEGKKTNKAEKQP